VATSSATFTRQIGGTLGTAIFLSILFTAVPNRIQTAFSTVAPTPEFQSALKNPQSLTGDPAANTAFIHSLQQAQAGGGGGGAVNPLSDSSFIQHLDPRLAKPFLIGFSEAMDLVFLIGAAVMVLAFIVVWFLPHVELRSGSSYESRANQDAADAAVSAEGEVTQPSLSH
jgi:phosphotransferase system  glucose/maltose/N-acetylglucosamine-specific IIC component